MTVISIRDLSVQALDRPDAHPLYGFDLDIASGEQLALLGARTSGAALLPDVLTDLDRKSVV